MANVKGNEKKKQRPEDAFVETFKSSKTDSTKVPTWVTKLTGFLLFDIVSNEYKIEKISYGYSKTVYKYNFQSISIEKSKNRERDEELYTLLKKIKGCPGVLVPEEVCYWYGFKFCLMDFCSAGDLTQLLPTIKPNEMRYLLKQLYEIGFTLLELNKVGIYPTDVKPENILYCWCGEGNKRQKYFTMIDFEGCILESDFIDDMIKPYDKTKKAFLTKNGYHFFSFTYGYSIINHYAFTGMPISKIEASFIGWYSYAHVFLQIYATVNQNKQSKAIEMLRRMYSNGRNFTRPPRVSRVENLLDFVAFKMIELVDSGFDFMDNQETFVIFKGYKITSLTLDCINVNKWQRYYNGYIIKQYDPSQKKVWLKNLQQQIIKISKR